MAEPKVQLVAPIGNITVPGMNITGVVTATYSDVGVAASIIQGNNIDIGTGIITATSFVGDQIGTYRAASLTGSPDLVVGVVTSSGFVAQITGDVTGNLTGNVVGTAGSIESGKNLWVGIATATLVGDGSNLTGVGGSSFTHQTIGTTYSIDVTSPAGGNYTLSGTDRNGAVSGSDDPTVTVEVGDTLNFVVDASGHPFYIRVSDGGANVSTPAATNQGAQNGTVSWTPNTAGTYYYQCGNHAGMLGIITVTATTTIDLSAGNIITFNQTANTTVSLANTSEAMSVTIIRVKDANTTARTITWPDSVKWNGGSAPTLVDKNPSGEESDQIQLLTRDGGVTWYGWLTFSNNKDDTPLFAWGQNYTGVNMQNNTISRSSPTQVGTVNTWDKDNVTMSKSFFNAIKTDGTAWTGGNNNYGVLGQNKSPGFGAGQQYAVSSPVQLPGSWSRFESGNESMWGVKTDGTAWSWGKNDSGTLGQNQEPSSLGAASSPTQIGTDTTWDQVGQMGNKSGFGVKTDGTMWVWGDATLGGLGLNGPVYAHKSSPTQIPGTTWTTNASGPFGGYSGAGIKTDGTLWVWGFNSSGQLGINDTTTYSSPKQVGTDTTWSQVKGMGNGMIALKTDNTLWAWGSNSYGALGQNSTTYYSSPVQVPAGPGTWSSFSASYKAGAAIKTDGTLWTWGNADGGMGGRNTNNPGGGRVSSPTQIPGTDWSSIHGGRTCRNFMATQSI